MADRRRLGMILSSSLLLFLLINLLPSNADVITLTEGIFSDKIKEKDTAWFVKFCVPWCKHCKKMGSLWEDMGKAMEGEDEIEIGEVDCSVSKPVCSKVDIHSYPTFKLFYNGEEFAKYQGSLKSLPALAAFLDYIKSSLSFGNNPVVWSVFSNWCLAVY